MEKKKNSNKLEESLIYVVLILAIASLIFGFYTILKPTKSNQTQHTSMDEKMGFTSFDKELAKEFMDKNNDDLCDACGMSIKDCIESGMIECSMSQDAKIGILHSQHIHADMKIFINGKMLDEEFFKSLADVHENSMKDSEVKITSSFIHVHEVSEESKEKVGDVLHMHATNVPLWLFFKSIEFEVPDKVKLYVNGKLNSEGLNYVFKEGDKLLLIDSLDEATIKQQINLISDYAKEY